MSKALYRKYRSKSLGEIVGQQHVTTILARSLAAGRVAHAYLLTGPRGVGKTSIARILAHEINQLPYDEDSTHLDIIEIDAASNNGVEDVRDLREKVQVAPVRASKKIYIIDEVHMLSKAAFNALLKTLEEPPEHAVFILATTDADKLPATIISRTQQFSFRAIAPDDAARHLRHIADEEKIKIDDDALALIARRGDGSFRDSISLLDQLRGVADGKTGITRELVEQALGLAPLEHVEKLLAAYEAKDLKRIVELLDESEASGTQAGVLVSQLVQTVREAIAEKPQLLPLLDQLLEVAKSSQPNIKLLTVLASHATPKPKSAALAAPAQEISAPIKELEEQAVQPTRPTPPAASKQANLRHASTGTTSLQSAELASAQTSSIGQEAAPVEAGQLDSVSSSARGAGRSAATPARVAPGGAAPENVLDGDQKFSGADRATGPAGSDATSRPKGGDDASGDSSKEVDEQISIDRLNPETFDWEKIIKYARQNFVAVYSVLTKCSPEIDGNKLVLYTGGAFYKKKLDDSKHRINLTKILMETGVGNIEVETRPTPPPPKDSTAAAVAAIMGGGEEVKVE